MKPVDQTTFGHPGGNCFSACVASLLDLSIDDVPYFMGSEAWFEGFLAWLKPFGFWAMTVRIEAAEQWRPGGLFILGGRSSRGSHAVIAEGTSLVHDPHPSREGLVAIEDATILVPFDPAMGVPLAARPVCPCGCGARGEEPCRQDEPEAPYVCPGCHAVGGEKCAADCIDAAMEREREAGETEYDENGDVLADTDEDEEGGGA
ncbi:MAG TPA: hypothetical protein VGI39_18010 [Polyangiaceae bacterium]